MKHAATAFALMLALCVASPLRADTPSSQIGPQTFDVERMQWEDDRRDRALPVKLYQPRGGGNAPVVLFSHGLGGSREAATYLCEHWAAKGDAVVAMQHPGSDESLWNDAPPGERGARLRRAVRNPRTAIDRINDVRFVLDELERRSGLDGPPAEGVDIDLAIDIDRVAVAGHSFGAWTTLAVGGRTFHRPGGRAWRPIDPRVDALLPLSPPVPTPPANPADSFATVRLPIMMMTGSLDDSPLTGVTAEQRRALFDLLPGEAGGAAPAYLVFLEGGDHAVFGGGQRWPGRGARGDPDLDPLFQRIIESTSTTFLDAHLRADDHARKRLRRTDLAADTDGRASMQHK